MARDGEVPAIFNPRRVRAPSVVVTGDSPNGPFGGFTPSGSAPPQITHSDSLTSSQPDASDHTTALMHSSGGCQTPTPTTDHAPTCLAAGPRAPRTRLGSCRDSCCSAKAQKIYFGMCVTLLVTATWVGATHCIKFLYLTHNNYATLPIIKRSMVGEATANMSGFILTRDSLTFSAVGFNAPFFASWFCTNFAIFFFPIYLMGRVAMKKCEAPGEILGDVLRGFRDRGFTVGRFLNRCLTFCILWLITTYLYALSLRALLATDVMALFATNVACVYLLSWVILHEQFVGVRIVAVILCDTGVALLAYMDGITGTPTLGGVVLAALAAAGYAVFKVMFKKVMGDPPVGEIAFTFSFLGFMNAALLWPVCIGLYLSGTEVMPWEIMPWIILLMASVLLLMFHLLTQFSAAITYNVFVTLGLITSVPVSAALDATLYGAKFDGMKLAGIILIGVGFFLVMLPDNWPDYITRLLRKTGRAILRYQCCCDYAEIDYANSKYHIVGSQREMGATSSKRNSWGPLSRCHRLSDGLHPFASSISLRQGEMTEQQFLQHLQLQQLSPYSSNINLSVNYPQSSSPTLCVAETNFMRTGSIRKYSYGSVE